MNYYYLLKVSSAVATASLHKQLVLTHAYTASLHLLFGVVCSIFSHMPISVEGAGVAGSGSLVEVGDAPRLCHLNASYFSV